MRKRILQTRDKKLKKSKKQEKEKERNGRSSQRHKQDHPIIKNASVEIAFSCEIFVEGEN